MGWKPDADFQKQSMDLGYWPPKEGPRVKGSPDTPEIYAIPSIGDVMSLVWRKDIFDKEPTTWDDIVANAEAKSDPAHEKYGWVTRGVKGNPIAVTFLPIMWSFGADVFDDKWNPMVNSDKAVQALEFYISLRKYMPDGVAEFDYDQEGATMLSGKVAAATLWTGIIRQLDLPDKSQVVGKCEFGICPKKERYASHIGLFICGVSEFSKNKEAAADFLFWFAQNDVQTRFATMGGTPVKVPAFKDPQVVAKQRWLPKILQSLDNSFPRPRTPDWQKLEDIWGTRINEAFVAKSGAKEKMDQAASEMKDYLTSQGYYS